MKKIFLLLLCLILICAPTLTYAQSQNTAKEEVVYTAITENGSVDSVHVVNGYNLSNETSIVDYGKYDEVINLSTDRPLKIEDDKITVDAQAGSFFYQGNNPKIELPWKLSFKYYKNNKEVNPSDLIGKSGKIKIKGSIQKNPKADPIYSEYFLLQVSLGCDSKKATVLEAKDSTFAMNGSIQLLNYTILPEKELEFSILLDAKNFEMEPIQISGLPFNMNFDMPDTDSFTDRLKELEDAISKVNNGGIELRNGFTQINQSTNQLISALESLSGGVTTITHAQSQFNDGQEDFQAGLKEYQGGIDELLAQMRSLPDQLQPLKDGLSLLASTQDQLESGLSQTVDGLSSYVDGVEKSANGLHQIVDPIDASFDSSAQALEDAGAQLVEGSEGFLQFFTLIGDHNLTEHLTPEALESIQQSIDLLLSQWDSILAILDNLNIDTLGDAISLANNQITVTIDSLQAVVNQMDQLLAFYEGNTDPQIQDIVAQIKSYRDTLYSNISALESVQSILKQFLDNESALSAAIGNLIDLNKELKPLLEQLKKALEDYDQDELVNVLTQLSGMKSKYQAFHNGLVQYVGGTNQLTNGLKPAFTGLKQLSSGLDTLANVGNNQLIPGVDTLQSGMHQFGLGLHQMNDELNIEMDLSRLDELEKGTNQLVTGHQELVNGGKQLEDGTIHLSEGLKKYLRGFKQFDDGLDSFDSGLNQYTKGTQEFHDQTRGMSDQAKKEIDEALSAYTKEGFELKSIVSKKNTNINHLQFVFLSNGLKEEKVVEEIKTEDSKKGPLDRLLDLFN